MAKNTTRLSIQPNIIDYLQYGQAPECQGQARKESLLVGKAQPIECLKELINCLLVWTEGIR